MAVERFEGADLKPGSGVIFHI